MAKSKSKEKKADPVENAKVEKPQVEGEAKVEEEKKGKVNRRKVNPKRQFMIPKSVFQKIVRDVIKQETEEKTLKVEKGAFAAIQSAGEEFLIDMFKDGKTLVDNKDRVTLYPKDIRTVISLTKPRGFKEYTRKAKSSSRTNKIEKIIESRPQEGAKLKEWVKTLQSKV